MTILSDRQLIELGDSIIKPFVSGQVREIGPNKVISFGVSSYGYDVRLDNKFKVFESYLLELDLTKVINSHLASTDPKHPNPYIYQDLVLNEYWLGPQECCLVQTLEIIAVPDDCLARVELKSTYARCHLLMAPVVLEPGWVGKATFSIYNPSPANVLLRSYEGFAQLVFHQGSERCQVSYADRNGKYQNQTEITTARV